MIRSLTLAATLAALSVPTLAQVQITEWMYQGNGGEFVEFTNIGSAPVDFTGWSYDDDNRRVGRLNLSAFGIVGVGESVLITENSAAAFRAAWGLDASVKIIGGYTNNLGREDEINLFDASGNLVDRLTYGDQRFSGTPRTQTSSGTPVSLEALVPFQTASGNWVLAIDGDAYGSWFSSAGDVGNPGYFFLSPVPEPGTVALLLAGLGVVGSVARRRRG